MIQLINLEMTSKEHSFRAYFDGAFIAKGKISFSSAKEMEEAKETIKKTVAENFAGDVKKVYITIQ